MRAMRPTVLAIGIALVVLYVILGVIVAPDSFYCFPGTVSPAQVPYPQCSFAEDPVDLSLGIVGAFFVIVGAVSKKRPRRRP